MTRVVRGRHARQPLITRIPLGVREQPAWIFIGVLFIVSGFGYVSGVSDSVIADAIGESGLRVWGSSMLFSGVLLIFATARAKPALEKMALRIVTCNLIAYAGWLMIVVPINRIITTVVLSGSLMVLGEFRVMHLRLLMKRTAVIRHELRERGYRE